MATTVTTWGEIDLFRPIALVAIVQRQIIVFVAVNKIPILNFKGFVFKTLELDAIEAFLFLKLRRLEVLL